MNEDPSVEVRKGRAGEASAEWPGERGRYEVVVDGEVAGFTQVREMPDGVWSFPHTVVEARFEGRGLASVLVRGALDDVRAAGATIAPHCPYVRGWIAKHPEYRDLVADPAAFDL